MSSFQKGFISQALMVLLLVAGIGLGTYLVQQRTNLLPKAAEYFTCNPVKDTGDPNPECPSQHKSFAHCDNLTDPSKEPKKDAFECSDLEKNGIKIQYYCTWYPSKCEQGAQNLADTTGNSSDDSSCTLDDGTKIGLGQEKKACDSDKNLVRYDCPSNGLVKTSVEVFNSTDCGGTKNLSPFRPPDENNPPPQQESVPPASSSARRYCMNNALWEVFPNGRYHLVSNCTLSGTVCLELDDEVSCYQPSYDAECASKFGPGYVKVDGKEGSYCDKQSHRGDQIEPPPADYSTTPVSTSTRNACDSDGKTILWYTEDKITDSTTCSSGCKQTNLGATCKDSNDDGSSSGGQSTNAGSGNNRTIAPASTNVCKDSSGKGFAAGGRYYTCANIKGPCDSDAGVGVPHICNNDGSWSDPNPKGECATDCKTGGSSASSSNTTNSRDGQTSAPASTSSSTNASNPDASCGKVDDGLGGMRDIPCYKIGLFDEATLLKTKQGAAVAAKNYDTYSKVLGEIKSYIGGLADTVAAKNEAGKKAADACVKQSGTSQTPTNNDPAGCGTTIRRGPPYCPTGQFKKCTTKKGTKGNCTVDTCESCHT